MAGSGRLLIHPLRDVTVVNFGDASILDSQHVQDIGEELFALVDKQARRKIVIDFAKVRFLSSSGAGSVDHAPQEGRGHQIESRVLQSARRPQKGFQAHQSRENVRVL